MRRCKKLAVFLVAVLLLSMVYSQPGVIEAQAATKNNITQVGIKALPKNNTIELGEYFNFDPVILNTQKGKGKATTGVVYFEVNGKTNTAGVQSARWGNMYPVYAGQFDVRAVAFANSADMRTWLAARKANGYVEDPKAAKYVTAYSDWETIKVTSEEEGLAVARWQKQLDLALKNKNVSNVLFTTDSEKEFTLKKGNYRYKSITIDAPNADVVNEGRFKEITVEQIKSSTFYEKAVGNKFVVKAPNASFHVEKDAVVGELVYRPATNNVVTPKLNIFGNGGSINKVSIAAKGEVNIDGNTENTVPVVVEESAEGAVLNTNIQLNLNVNASIKLDVGALATNTVVNLLKAVEAVLSGAAENLNVNVSKEAEGAVVKSETAITVKAEANVKVELGEGAEGSEITTGENVNVEVKNETTEDVTIKDNNGNSTTVEKGEEVVPTVTPTPNPTDTPSNPTVPTSTPTPKPTSTPAQVKVDEITVTSKDDVTTINQNQTLKLTATVKPDNATDKEVTWTSNKPSVATVDGNGLVTGLSQGDAIITATAKDGSNVTGTFKVTVTEKVIEVIKAESIEIISDKNVTKLAPNGTLQLTANVKPDNATYKTVTWKSSDEKVATVNENGLVTGVKVGEVVITATANDGSGVTNNITLNVTNDVILVTKISITSKDNITEIVEGGTLQLEAAVEPDNATNKTVQWISNDSTIATVDDKGLVTAKSAGTVEIFAKAMDGSPAEDSIRITVTKKPVTEIKVDNITVTSETGVATIAPQETLKLIAAITPENANNKVVTWTSENEAIATVDPQTGVVTGVSGGTTDIIATATDGSEKTGKFTVNVESQGSAATLESISYEIEGTSYTIDTVESKYIIVKVDDVVGKNVKIIPKTTDNKATITFQEEIQLNNTVTTVGIEVTAEDGITTENYTIYFVCNPLKNAKVTKVATTAAVSGDPIFMENGIVKVTTGTTILKVDGVSTTGNVGDTFTISYTWYTSEELGDKEKWTAINQANSDTCVIKGSKVLYVYVTATVKITLNEQEVELFTFNSKKTNP